MKTINNTKQSFKFPTRKAHTKVELKQADKPIYDDKDSDSDHSTSDGSRKSSGPQIIYVPKKTSDIPDAPLPANSEWKIGYIAKSEKPLQSLVVKSECIQVVKNSTNLQARVNSILSAKQVSDYFTEKVSLKKAHGTEAYEAIASTELTTDEVDALAEKKIKCSFNGRNYFHVSAPVFGYLIYYELDAKNQRVPVLLPELVSFKALPKLLKIDAENLEMENVIAFKSENEKITYHHWLPIYINDEHYKCVKSYIKNVIVRLAGLRSKNLDFVPEYEPSMILDTLIPMFGKLLNKIQKEKDVKEKEVEALGHLFHLINKLVSGTKLQEKIDEKISAFFEEQNQDKLTKPALDSFLVLTLFSSFDILSHEFSSVLFKKLFIVSLNICLKIKESHDPEAISFALNGATKLLTLYRESCFFLLNKENLDDLEVRYGVLNGKRVSHFLKVIGELKKSKAWDINVLSECFGECVSSEEMKKEIKDILNEKELQKIKAGL